MKQQNYANHRKYYIPHHFILLPLLTFLLIVGIRNAFVKPDQELTWTLFSVIIFCILYVAIMMRQHYALGNQDRIVRVEFRLRYFELYSKSAKEVESKLSFSQLAALRFADDSEFRILIDRALNENLSGDKIKKSIKNWQADDMRV